MEYDTTVREVITRLGNSFAEPTRNDKISPPVWFLDTGRGSVFLGSNHDNSGNNQSKRPNKNSFYVYMYLLALSCAYGVQNRPTLVGANHALAPLPALPGWCLIWNSVLVFGAHLLVCRSDHSRIESQEKADWSLCTLLPTDIYIACRWLLLDDLVWGDNFSPSCGKIGLPCCVSIQHRPDLIFGATRRRVWDTSPKQAGGMDVQNVSRALLHWSDEAVVAHTSCGAKGEYSLPFWSRFWTSKGKFGPPGIHPGLVSFSVPGSQPGSHIPTRAAPHTSVGHKHPFIWGFLIRRHEQRTRYRPSKWQPLSIGIW